MPTPICAAENPFCRQLGIHVNSVSAPSYEEFEIILYIDFVVLYHLCPVRSGAVLGRDKPHMKTTARSRLVSIVVLMLAGTMSTVAIADMILITSNNAASSNQTSYGGFFGSLQYDFLGNDSALMTLTLTNTSQFDGKLVALAFDAAADTSGWTFSPAMSSGLSSAWSDIAGSINTAPFGMRSFGASNTSSWVGGGSPNTGLHVGDTGVWIFEGMGADSVSAADFLSPNGGYNLMIRFRGFSNGASDKLPAMPDEPPPVVPGFVGLPLIALAGLRRRRRRR